MATRSARDNKALNARHAEVLKAMLRRPENKTCVDCKRNDPRWASTNLGCFMCIRCSGIHRSMGVHITRIKSVDLDTWTPEQVENVQRWGNKRANAYWEAHLRPGHMPPDHKIESFIRSKYETKKWALEGPIPEPESLDDDDDQSARPSVSTTVPLNAVVQKLPSPTLAKASNISLLDAPPATSNQSSQNHLTQGTSIPNSSLAAQNPSKNSNITSGLFDLDFSPQASSAAAVATAPAARKDLKNDILSLFAGKPQGMANQTQASGYNFSMNMPNNQLNGMTFGASSVVPPAMTSNHSTGFLHQSQFGNQKFGETPSSISQDSDLFGSFTSGGIPNSNSKKDVFSDIWN
ncbi:hypothetical protein O181_002596 [Austropuccinia psidii MF-1]|uniref:Arf-GAP domain-containing protein n=1 Tax=Austropuccinia psidii MF-1 TaxID=1389203 RepID=A0A9Q3GDE4_9BASI|nr:hypothetical protein [Austropuccinia psidii MF-1]